MRTDPAPIKISLQSVSMQFTAKRGGIQILAVDDVTLDIVDKSFVCLVGPSGCGKSALT
jgi:NitT/TauT family transport system ATP-binding protein